MGWDDVELAARRQAREITWRTPGAEVVGRVERRVERTVRKVLGRPTEPSAHHHQQQHHATRLVMVVPTAGGPGVAGTPKTYGWAVRLTEHGHLEYLRWQAFGEPDWNAPFPFQEHDLHPLTPGADHWGHLDVGQRLKTDLDWSPTHAVRTNSAESPDSWQIVPRQDKAGVVRAGDGLIRALAAMPKTEHPVLDALPLPDAITP